MEDDQQCERTQRRKGLKRKLDEEDSPSSSFGGAAGGSGSGDGGGGRTGRGGGGRGRRGDGGTGKGEVLERSFSCHGADRAAAKTASHILAEDSRKRSKISFAELKLGSPLD